MVIFKFLIIGEGNECIKSFYKCNKIIPFKWGIKNNLLKIL